MYYRLDIRFSLTFLFLFSFTGIDSQVSGKYWVQFTDKRNSSYTVSNPNEFLSERAINKRNKYHIAIDESDLPVTHLYLDSITHLGFRILNTSKWFNSATIFVADTTNLKLLRGQTFVRHFERTTAFNTAKSLRSNKLNIRIADSIPLQGEQLYGSSYTQIHQLNGDFLHQLGFRGRGMVIAIIDAGFYHADQLPAFDSLFSRNAIKGTKDFVNPGGDVYQEHQHGMEVLSLIGGNVPGTIVGTAPDASFWLLRSEDADTENPIEEDNWVSAAEFADSAGVDVINTSLGYTTFDDPSFNKSYKDMNGKTARISVGANIAASKGILVEVSAGNNGSDSWHYIDAPADAFNVLTVGAVDNKGEKAGFSSFGPSYDGRIKPDVSAMGVNNFVQSPDGNFGVGSGTSFSGPEITGLATCLWQAFPDLSNYDVIRNIKLSCNHYYSPDSLTGYGIPDFEKAYNLIKKQFSIPKGDFLGFPSLFNDHIYLNLNDLEETKITVEIYELNGAKIAQYIVNNEHPVLISGLQSLATGMYILKCSDSKRTKFTKIIKR